jgi:mannose-1-phosphate guanylyltransferase
MVDAVRQQLPELPARQVIGEPSPLGTAPAAALGAAVVRGLGVDGVLCLLSADHAITPAEGFRETLRAAAAAASRGYLTTIGIPPSFPATGYGYLELGDPIEGLEGAYTVARFREKPELEVAEALVASGRSLWNAGMFVWTVDTAFSEVRRHLPRLGEQMEAIASAVRAAPEAYDAGLDAIWGTITDRTTLDYGVAERSGNVAGVIASFTWNDVGAWDALAELVEPDAAGNVVVGTHVGFETDQCIVVSRGGRVVATLGAHDLIIVDTEDAVLVCPRNRAQDVKRMVDELQRVGEEGLL